MTARAVPVPVTVVAVTISPLGLALAMSRVSGYCRLIVPPPLERLAPVFDEVHAAARAQGLPVETLMSEYAPGQFELTLAHRDEALRAVDEAVMLKRLLRGVAAKHGLAVTFMAKPYAELAGSGMHLHVSLADAAGQNLFAAEDPAGSPLMRQALGGLRATMAESLLAMRY
jgi:glutamine synthetase